MGEFSKCYESSLESYVWIQVECFGVYKIAIAPEIVLRQFWAHRSAIPAFKNRKCRIFVISKFSSTGAVFRGSACGQYVQSLRFRGIFLKHTKNGVKISCERHCTYHADSVVRHQTCPQANFYEKMKMLKNGQNGSKWTFLDATYVFIMKNNPQGCFDSNLSPNKEIHIFH